MAAELPSQGHDAKVKANRKDGVGMACPSSITEVTQTLTLQPGRTVRGYGFLLCLIQFKRGVPQNPRPLPTPNYMLYMTPLYSKAKGLGGWSWKVDPMDVI